MKSINSLYLIIGYSSPHVLSPCFRWPSSNPWNGSDEPYGFDRTQVKNHCYAVLWMLLKFSVWHPVTSDHVTSNYPGKHFGQS